MFARLEKMEEIQLTVESTDAENSLSSKIPFWSYCEARFDCLDRNTFFMREIRNYLAYIPMLPLFKIR